MGSAQLFVLSVAVYVAVPLGLLALRRGSPTFELLYAHIAAVLTLGGFLGALYALPLFGDVTLLAGQVAYGGFVFAILVTTIAGRDIQVVRTMVGLTLAVNLLVAVVSAVSGRALRTDSVPNPFGVDPAVLDHTLRVVVAGGALIVLELLALVWVLEAAKRRLRPSRMLAVYPAAYVAVLVADGALFPLAALAPAPDLGALVWGQVQAKAVLAAAFAVPLIGYVALARRSVELYEESPLELRQLLSSWLGARDARPATSDGILDAATSTLIIGLDTELRVTHFNSGAERLSGYRAEEVLGRFPPIVGDPQGLSAWAAASTRHDVDYRSRDGSTRTLSLTAHEITVEGEPAGYVITGEDVSARVRSEQAMLRALQRERDADARLAEADRVKNDLVSTVSHELRTPIASIQGYSEMLATGEFGDLTTAQATAVDRVQRNTGRLKQLVDDLLLLERVEGPAFRFERHRIDLREVVTASADWTRDLLEGREVALGVSQPWEPVWVDGDGTALERLLTNLTSNAAKFTTEGRVDVGLETDAGVARLWVRDTGIGIAAEDQEQLFTRFFRAEEAQTLAIQGSGLGLSIVHGIALGHGGTVVVDSTPGHGTTVTVTLPRA